MPKSIIFIIKETGCDSAWTKIHRIIETESQSELNGFMVIMIKPCDIQFKNCILRRLVVGTNVHIS